MFNDYVNAMGTTSGTPNAPKTNNVNNENKPPKEDKGIFSKYLNENDRSFTVEEQIDYAKSLAMQNDVVNEAVQKGFDIQSIIATLASTFKPFMDVLTGVAERVTTSIVQKNADEVVAKVVAEAKTFNTSKNNKTSESNKLLPPNDVGEGWGMEDAHFDYIYEKLSANGITDVSIELLADIMARFDYDLLSDDVCTVKADNPLVYDKSYLDKDENGNPTDTHALDFMVNQYLQKTGQVQSE